MVSSKTSSFSSSAIREILRCKVEKSGLRTIYVYLQPLWRNRPAKLSNLVK